MICSPKNWMNCDMQPAGCVICTRRHKQDKRLFSGLLFWLSANVDSPLFNLHFGMHAAVEGGDAPGRAGRHQAVSCRGKDGPLVLVEGLQWRVLAWTL